MFQAVEIFYETENIAVFDFKTTHTIGLYRTHGKKEGAAMAQFLCLRLNPTDQPDIFALLLI